MIYFQDITSRKNRKIHLVPFNNINWIFPWVKEIWKVMYIPRRRHHSHHQLRHLVHWVCLAACQLQRLHFWIIRMECKRMNHVVESWWICMRLFKVEMGLLPYNTNSVLRNIIHSSYNNNYCIYYKKDVHVFLLLSRSVLLFNRNLMEK